MNQEQQGAGCCAEFQTSHFQSFRPVMTSSLAQSCAQDVAEQFGYKTPGKDLEYRSQACKADGGYTGIMDKWELLHHSRVYAGVIVGNVEYIGC